MSSGWEERMAARARERAVDATPSPDVLAERAWDEFCRERGGWSSGWERLWHGHWAAHGNVIVSAVDGTLGGVFSVALTGDEPDPIDECPICRDAPLSFASHTPRRKEAPRSTS